MPTQDQIQAAIVVLNDHGIDFRAPWECTLDDREQERFEALRDAIDAALMCGVAIGGVSAPMRRIDRAKAIREEKQCSLQEAVRIERIEFQTAQIEAATTIEDLKPVLLSLVRGR